MSFLSLRSEVEAEAAATPMHRKIANNKSFAIGFKTLPHYCIDKYILYYDINIVPVYILFTIKHKDELMFITLYISIKFFNAES